MSELLLSIDVGNTKTALAVVNAYDWTVVDRRELPTNKSNGVIKSIMELIDRYFHKTDVDVCYCSVVSDNSVLLKLQEIGILNINKISYKNVPFDIHYKLPEFLGKDRIADALFAFHFYKGKNVVIIDCGSAVTVDLLTADNGYFGGFIIPGIKMQLSALSSNTSALPNVDIKTCLVDGVPNTTADAICSGVLRSVAGGINSAVKEIQKQYTIDIVIASGGGWDFLTNYIDFEYRKHFDMTVIGCALCALF